MAWLEILILCMIILAGVCLVSIWHASTHFHKVFYRLSSDKISKPVKFVLLSDLHDRTYGVHNEKLLKAIETEQADAILVAGDMLTPTKGREKVAEALIQKLAERYPVFYGLGNHEAKMGWNKEKFGDRQEEYLAAVTGENVHILRNAYASFRDKVRIYGLDLPHEYYKRFERFPMEEQYLESLLGEADRQYFNILIAHNPAYFDHYAGWKPDLVVSGHVHGGLVRLPFWGGVIAPSLQLFPKYDGGRFKEKDAIMILSRGLGFHSIEFRMWNPGELVVIEVVPAGGFYGDTC